MRRALLAGLLCIGCAAYALDANRPSGDYALKPQAVAEGIYVFTGHMENFSRSNGGDISNTGFIVGKTGIIVIDTGPSQRYGEQQRAAIAKVTALPVTRIYITHAHPDHFLGDQAYAADLIASTAAARSAILKNGETLSANLYRMVGGWMSGTTVVVPTLEAVAGDIKVGGRDLRLFASAGHTDGDLMVYDSATKTLFAGDLVFYQRAPTTPNADISVWLNTLNAIDAVDFDVLVPGHGPVVRDHAAIAQTRDYLRWLRDSLQDAANRGLDMSEVMKLPLPPRFKGLAVVDSEYTRSISHLYPKIELMSLPQAGPVT